MKFDLRNFFSKLLITSGILILLVVGGYELSIYPWHLVFGQGEIALKDPAPLPQELVKDENVEEIPQDTPTEEMPENPSLSISRPKVDLVQFGIFQIPKLRVSENLVSGVGDEMYYGIGHYPGTALPGQKGNCVTAGHRNHILAHALRHLDKMELGDQIKITYQNVVYTYEVSQILVVDPSETWVMNSNALAGESHFLTVITCTPALNATHRLILHAKQIDPVPMVEEKPADQTQGEGNEQTDSPTSDIDNTPDIDNSDANQPDNAGGDPTGEPSDKSTAGEVDAIQDGGGDVSSDADNQPPPSQSGSLAQEN